MRGVVRTAVIASPGAHFVHQPVVREAEVMRRPPPAAPPRTRTHTQEKPEEDFCEWLSGALSKNVTDKCGYEVELKKASEATKSQGQPTFRRGVELAALYASRRGGTVRMPTRRQRARRGRHTTPAGRAGAGAGAGAGVGAETRQDVQGGWLANALVKELGEYVGSEVDLQAEIDGGELAVVGGGVVDRVQGVGGEEGETVARGVA